MEKIWAGRNKVSKFLLILCRSTQSTLNNKRKFRRWEPYLLSVAALLWGYLPMHGSTAGYTSDLGLSHLGKTVASSDSWCGCRGSSWLFLEDLEEQVWSQDVASRVGYHQNLGMQLGLTLLCSFFQGRGSYACMPLPKYVAEKAVAHLFLVHIFLKPCLGNWGLMLSWMFRENSIETSILSSVKQITSPGWMHETSAQGWCTGKTQRDGVGREAGRGNRIGNTCKSMADSCQCMAKTTTIL